MNRIIGWALLLFFFHVLGSFVCLTMGAKYWLVKRALSREE